LVGFEGFAECSLHITKIEMTCFKSFRSKAFKTYQRPLIDMGWVGCEILTKVFIADRTSAIYVP
jgi:hypothetical protein